MPYCAVLEKFLVCVYVYVSLSPLGSAFQFKNKALSIHTHTQNNAIATMFHCGNGVVRVTSSVAFLPNIALFTETKNIFLGSKMAFKRVSSHFVPCLTLWSCTQLLPSKLAFSPFELKLIITPYNCLFFILRNEIFTQF